MDVDLDTLTLAWPLPAGWVTERMPGGGKKRETVFILRRLILGKCREF